MQINSIQQNQNNNAQSFGMLYSNKTIKSLKKIVPELIKEEGFENTKSAITILKKLGLRKDNIMVQLIAEDGFYETIEPAVNRVKNKKFNGFIYGLEPHFHVGIGSSKTPFLDFVKTLETKEFVDAAHSSIDKHVNYIKKQTFKDKISQKTREAKELLEDGLDWLGDKLSLIDNPPRLDGRKRLPTLVAWDDFKEWLYSLSENRITSKDKNVAILRKEIDTLPTKL